MIFLLPYISCGFYYIRQYHTEYFMTSQVTEAVSPTLSGFEYADTYEVRRSEKDPETMEIWVVGTEDLVLDIAESKTKLIQYPYHGGKNQRFKMNAINMEGVFSLGFKKMCLTYVREYENFEMKKCNPEDVMQQFEFLNAEAFAQYMAEGGHPGGGKGGAMGGGGAGGGGEGGEGGYGGGEGGGGAGGGGPGGGGPGGGEGGAGEGGGGAGGGGPGGGGPGGGGAGEGGAGGGGGGGGGMPPGVLHAMYEMIQDMHGVILGTAGYGYGMSQGGRLPPSAQAALGMAQGHVQGILSGLAGICHMM